MSNGNDLENLRSARAILIGRICLKRRQTGNAGEGMKILKGALYFIDKRTAYELAKRAEENDKR